MNPSFRVHAVETDRGVRARTLRSVWRELARVGVHLIDVRVTLSDVNGTAFGFPYHIDYLITARARVGYAWDRTMLFGTGGVAFTRASLGGIHGTDTGWTLGAGLEWAFSHGWSAKAEYAYYNFENNIDLSMVKFGVNYRFGSVWYARSTDTKHMKPRTEVRGFLLSETW